MPIYIYKCDNCKELHVVKQSIKDKPFSECPFCSKGTVHRVIQPTVAHFKGKGFYETDYKKKG